MDELERRRSYTNERLAEIRSALEASEATVRGRACVYATGSFGRGEASEYSDLDLFIVGLSKGSEEDGEPPVSMLKRLDEICIKADLIRLTRRLGFPDFSGDGKFLAHHSSFEFTKNLGAPYDDALNTFTARLLLLLESASLLELGVFEDLINDVLNSYWRDYDDHQGEFIPAFLANDILRLWRTLCVNYEAQTSSAPAEKKAKRKVKNYKLKHSRLLTCYSAILYLLASHKKRGTVDRDDALAMIRLSPTARIEWLLNEGEDGVAESMIKVLLNKYNRFLEVTNCHEDELWQRFMDEKVAKDYMNSAYDFGDSIFKIINKIGGETRFHRLLVV